LNLINLLLAFGLPSNLFFRLTHLSLSQYHILPRIHQLFLGQEVEKLYGVTFAGLFMSAKVDQNSE